MKSFKIILMLQIMLLRVAAFAQEMNTVLLNKVHSELSVEQLSRSLAHKPSFKVVSRDKEGNVKGSLGDISVYQNNLFYKLEVANGSNIPFDIDFIRFYVRDLETAKRTVTQEQELYPVSSYGTERTSIQGKSSAIYVFSLSKFPITKDKALFVEIYEKNGGRHLYLKAKQRDITRASAMTGATE